MPNDRLIHDAAWSIALSLVKTMSGRFRDEGRKEAFTAFYAAIRAGIEDYENQVERMMKRLGPTRG
jgi:hypothetical protein